MSEHINQVSFNGQAITLVSEHAFDQEQLLDQSCDITSFAYAPELLPTAGIPVVKYSYSDEIAIAFDDLSDTISVAGPKSKFEFGRSLLYIAEYLATSVQSAREGIFLAHAAATYNSDTENSYLILGEKGSGKTTLAIRLCHELGHLMIGNDQVYLGGETPDTLTTYAGNKWFNVRNTALESDKSLKKLITKAPDNSTKPSWNNKQRVEPSSLGIGTHCNPASIADVIHLRIDSTQPDLYVKSWEGVQRNLIIHEKLGRHVLGQATPFQDDQGNYLGSLPLIHPSQTIRQRDALTRTILERGITELFVPDSDSALQYFSEVSGK